LREQSPSGATVLSGTIEIEVAPVELIDKLAILEIKRERIHERKSAPTSKPNSPRCGRPANRAYRLRRGCSRCARPSPSRISD